MADTVQVGEQTVHGCRPSHPTHTTQKVLRRSLVGEDGTDKLSEIAAVRTSDRGPVKLVEEARQVQ